MTFLPYLSGERTPHNDAAIRGAFTGLGHETGRAALTQAVLEGVAFAFRDSLEALRAAGTELDAGHRDRRRLALALLAEGDRHRARPAGRHSGRRRFRRGLRRGAARPDRRREAPIRFAVCTRAARPSATIEPDRRARRRLSTMPTQRYRALYPAIRGVSRR